MERIWCEMAEGSMRVWCEAFEGSMDTVWKGRADNVGMVGSGQGVNGYGVKRSRGQWVWCETVEE